MVESEGLRNLVEKLKNNEEKVGKEVLQTRYKKPYEKLRSEIKITANTLINRKLTENLLVTDNERGYCFLDTVKRLLKHKKEKGIDKKLGKMLSEDYDVDGFLSLVESLQQEILEIYLNYVKETGI